MVSKFWIISLNDFVKWHDYMSKSTNSVLLLLLGMSENDCQCILTKNVRQICDKRRISKAELRKKWNLKTYQYLMKMKLENVNV